MSSFSTTLFPHPKIDNVVRICLYFSHPPILFFSEPESLIDYPSYSCEAFAFFPQLFQLFKLFVGSTFQVAFISRPPTLFFPELESLSSINFIRAEPLQSFLNYFPATGPYLRLNRFQGWQAVKQKR